MLIKQHLQLCKERKYPSQDLPASARLCNVTPTDMTWRSDFERARKPMWREIPNDEKPGVLCF